MFYCLATFRGVYKDAPLHEGWSVLSQVFRILYNPLLPVENLPLKQRLSILFFVTLLLAYICGKSLTSIRRIGKR
jgi:hypothetical protein